MLAKHIQRSERSRRWQILSERASIALGGCQGNFRLEAKIDAREEEQRREGRVGNFWLPPQTSCLLSLAKGRQHEQIRSCVISAPAHATPEAPSRIGSSLSPHVEFVEWEHQRVEG